VRGSRPELGPNVLRPAESLLAAASGLGLDLPAMSRILSVVGCFVAGFALRELRVAQQRRRAGLPQVGRETVAPYLREGLSSGRYPTLAPLVRAFLDGTGPPAGGEAERAAPMASRRSSPRARPPRRWASAPRGARARNWWPPA